MTKQERYSEVGVGRAASARSSLKPPASGKIKLPPADACDSPLLLVPLDHVFFLTDQDFMRSRDEAMLVYDPPNDDVVGARKHLLDKLRSLSERQPK